MVRALTRLTPVAVLAAIAFFVSTGTASAAIVQLQVGTLATGTTGNVTPTLPSASTAGTLLVATLTNKTPGNVWTAPSGWVSAILGNNGCCGRVQIWYYANNPGGITSAAFTSAGGTVAGQLSEWNGVASSSPVDQTGSQNHASGSSFTVQSSGNVAQAGELGIAVWQNSGTGATSQTATSPWAHLFNDLTQNRVADYSIGLTTGAKASNTESFTPNLSSMAAIATFRAAACSGGPLSLTAPATTSFPSTTLNGTNQTASTTVALAANDQTGSGAGWNVTGTSTTFTTGTRTLSTSATSVNSVTGTAGGGNCSTSTNSITYPITLPAGSTAPTAVKLYNASAGTGAGPVNLTATMFLSLPANSYVGAYSSTWTFAIVSGP